MIAAHFDNLIFLLLLAVALLFQLLARAVGKKNTDEVEPTSKPAPRMPKPIPRVPAESDEERIRKFLEALGQPAASKPPPIIKAPVEAYAAPKAFGDAKGVELKTDIATLLASKSGLRDAIILREIFGPPRSLQGLDLQ